MKKLKDYHWICPEPFANLHTQSGIPKPCCVMCPEEGADQYINSTDVKTVKEISFEEYWNSSYLKRLRNAMKNGGDDDILNKICSVCVHQEKAGTKSHRQFYIERFENDFSHIKADIEKTIESEDLPSVLYSVELDHLVGNACNLSCAYCSPFESSSYDKESVKLGENPPNDFDFQKTVSQTINSYRDADTGFNKDLHKLVNMAEEIKFAGGEPLLSKKVYEVFEMVEKPEQKQIRVVTNGTKSVDKFIEKTKNFKKVTVNMSIEGIGEFNEYIRYPTTWNSVQENVCKFMGSKHINFYLTPTHNAISLGRLHELCDFFGDDIVTTGSIVMNNFYSLSSVPPDIKDLYLNKLYQYGKYNVVKFAIRYLENANFNEKEMYSMLAHIKRRDKLREMCLLDHVPEWTEYYNNVIDTVGHYDTNKYFVDLRKKILDK